MNPQQFNNMMMMGRGGVVNGNPNGNPNLNVQQMPGQGQGQEVSIVSVIYNKLNQQVNAGASKPWQHAVPQPAQERARKIKMLFDQLRLLPHGSQQRALGIALQFESHTWTQSESIEEYAQLIQSKMHEIHAQRQESVNSGRVGPASVQPQNFQQMSVMNPRHDANLTGQTTNASILTPAFQLQNDVTAYPSAQPAINPARPSQLSEADNHAINARAAQMARNTTPDQREQILASIPPELKARFSARSIDPVIVHFRNLAQKDFFANKTGQVGQVGVQAGPGFVNNARLTTPVQNLGDNGSVFATPINLRGMNGNINFDQFQNQQEAGKRSQGEGELVVPASSNTNNTQAMINGDVQKNLWALMKKQYPNADPSQLRQLVGRQLQNMQRNSLANRPQNASPSVVGQGQNLNGAVALPNPVSMLTQPANPGVPVSSPAQHIQHPQLQFAQPQMSVQAGNDQNQKIPPPPGCSHQMQMNWQAYPAALQHQLRATPPHMWPQVMQAFKQRLRPQSNMVQEGSFSQPQQVQQPLGQNPNLPQDQNDMLRFPNTPFLGDANINSTSTQPIQNPPQNGQQMQRTQQSMKINPQDNLQLDQRNNLINQDQTQSVPQPNMQRTNADNLGQFQPSAQQQIQYWLSNSLHMPVPNALLDRLRGLAQTKGISMPPVQSWIQLREFIKAQGMQDLTNFVTQAHLKFAESLQRKQGLAPPHPQAPAPAQSDRQDNYLSNRRNATALQAAQPPPSHEVLWKQKVAELVQRAKRTPPFAGLADALVAQRLKESGHIQRLYNQFVASLQGQVSNTNITQQGPQNPFQNPGQAGNLPVQTTQQPVSTGQARTQQLTSQDAKPLKRPSPDSASAAPVTTGPTLPQYTQEQYNQLSLEDKQKYQLAKRNHKIGRLTQEVRSQIQRKPPIANMTSDNYQRNLDLLSNKTTTDMLKQYEAFLTISALNEEDDGVLRALISHRIQLMEQYDFTAWKMGQVKLNKVFTLMPDNIEAMLATIRPKFDQAKLRAQRKPPSHPQQTQQLGSDAPVMQRSPQGPMQLTTENLIRVSAEAQAQQQKVNKQQKTKDNAPPAPTTHKAPFGFPPKDGQGVPTEYGVAGLTQDQLKIPPAKKPKHAGQGSAPASIPASSANVPTEPQKPAFKCHVAGCNVVPNVFSAEAELVQHNNIQHNPNLEAVNDPIGFLHSGLQQGLNLDSNLQSKKTPTGAPPPPRPDARPSTTENATNNLPETKAAVKSVKSDKADIKVPMGSATQVKQSLLNDPAWEGTNFTLSHLEQVFGMPEQGDIVPTQENTAAIFYDFVEDWLDSTEWKQIQGGDALDNNSEIATSASKSQPEGSELVKQKDSEEPWFIDLTINGQALPDLEGDFGGLLVAEEQMDNDWEMIGQTSKKTDKGVDDWMKIEGSDDDWSDLINLNQTFDPMDVSYDIDELDRELNVAAQTNFETPPADRKILPVKSKKSPK